MSWPVDWPGGNPNGPGKAGWIGGSNLDASRHSVGGGFHSMQVGPWNANMNRFNPLMNNAFLQNPTNPFGSSFASNFSNMFGLPQGGGGTGYHDFF